jgi:hypothetical protein
MELLSNTLFRNDDLIVKNATLNKNKIAWWLSMPHLSGGKYLYDLFELSNATLTNVGSGYGWTSSTRPGGYSQIYLSGNTDYLSITDQSKFQFDTSNFTISGWFKLDTLNNANANGQQVIISRYESAGSKGFYVSVNTSGSIIFTISLSGAANASFASSTGLIATNTWYHFTAVRSGLSCFIYVNGKLEASGTSAALWSLSSTTQNVLLGDMVDSSSNHYYLSGIIDDICIYNIDLPSFYAYRIYEESRLGYPSTLHRMRITRPFHIGAPWAYYTMLQNTYGVAL